MNEDDKTVVVRAVRKKPPHARDSADNPVLGRPVPRLLRPPWYSGWWRGVAAQDPAAASAGDGRVAVVFVQPDGPRSAVCATLVTP